MSWLRRLINTLRPGRLHRDIERELSFHIAERADQLQAQGLRAEEATRLARIQFGNPIVQRERTRDVDISGALDATMRNVRYAFRTLVHTPGFTVTVVLTLALGIGANTAVFSAIDAVLLRPLPFPDGDRLVLLEQIVEGSSNTGLAPVRIEDWNRQNSTFDGITGYYIDDVVDTRGELPTRFRRAFVAPRFFEVMGVQPLMGHGFGAVDHHYGGPITLVISDRRWRSLGADPGIVGRAVRVGPNSIETIGIMPASFQFPATDGPIRVRVSPLKDTVVGGSRGSLWLLFGSVSVLLLIACTNIAALLLSRASKREHEIAVRYSLGGSRRAVAAQLLTESAVLAFTGALAGLFVAVAATRSLQSIAPDLPRVNEIAIDGRILVYTIASTVVVAILCGLFPALRGARGGALLPGSARGHVSYRQSVQWLLIGVQVALSVTLLAGAGLLIRSIDALSRVDVGFDSARVLTLHVSGSYGWETTDGAVQRINRVLDGIASLPGVESAAITTLLPGVRNENQSEFSLAEGRADDAPRLIAASRVVSPGYFQTMRIPLVAGDLCQRTADAGGKGKLSTEVMVNQRFADLYLANRQVIGLHLSGSLDALVKNGHLFGTTPSRIAGIVGDARERSADREPSPTVYACFSAPNPAPWHIVRTSVDPLTMAETIRRKIRELEPQRSVYDISLLDDRIGDAYAQNRLRTSLLTFFALTALALVCAGVYGTLSYAVSLRRREVALRLALGALRRTVVNQLMATTVRIVGTSSAVGLVLALLFAQSLSTMLYGVTPTDPVTLSGVVVVVVAVAFIAALIPAARAAFVQPMRALRED